MPLYEYRCSKCGDVFEVIQKFSDEPVKTHEACGGDVERLVSSPAFQFKGSGWYITDYARSGSSKGGEKKADGNSNAKSDGSSTPAKSSDSGSSSTPSSSSTTDTKK